MMIIAGNLLIKNREKNQKYVTQCSENTDFSYTIFDGL